MVGGEGAMEAATTAGGVTRRARGGRASRHEETQTSDDIGHRPSHRG
jgi:hypothetical protein